MSTALQEFQAVLRDRGVSESTRQAYLSDVRGFLKANVIPGVDDDNADKLATKWINSLKGTVVEKTVKRREVAVRLFCKEVLGVDVLAIEPVERAPRQPIEEGDIWSRIGLPTLKSSTITHFMPTPGAPSGPWTNFSACKDTTVDKTIFFDGRRKDQAKSICDQCPVSLQCLQFALDNEIEHGVWGGMDENERKDVLGRYVRVRRAETA